MSRATAGAPIVVKPSNNVYTALLGAALLAAGAAVIVVIMKYYELGWDPFRPS